VRIDTEGPLEERLGNVELARRTPGPDVGHRLHDKAPGVQALGRAAFEALVFRRVEAGPDRCDDTFGDLVLEGAEVDLLDVISVGPDVEAGGGVAQLSADPEALT